MFHALIAFSIILEPEEKAAHMTPNAMAFLKLIAVTGLLAAFNAGAAFARGIPDISAEELEQALALSGSNRAEMDEALDYCNQKPYMLQAMKFVIGNLPLADLGSVSADALIENLELAMEARANANYGSHYDDAIWAHWVLPPRESQEPLSPWRAFFMGELTELVADCETLEEAAVKVNYWCGERVGFKQTQRRDQEPLVTLKSGYGRCEEMVIFYVAACRSVGIPVRKAYCPFWATGDNNHAWVEVYGSDHKWHFTGGCEPRETLDAAWFEGAVKNAPIIVSMCFGLPGERTDDVLSWGDAPGARYCSINSTAFYRQTGWLDLDIPEAAGGGYNVVLHVFNFGALRQIARVDIGSDSHAKVELGAGTYIVTTSAPVGDNRAWVVVEPGETTSVLWADTERPPDDLLLQFPADPK